MQLHTQTGLGQIEKVCSRDGVAQTWSSDDSDDWLKVVDGVP